jgi:hypothetical protein
MSMTNGPYVIEEQTGRVFAIHREERRDHVAAIISVVYLIILISLFYGGYLIYWQPSLRS